MDPERRWSMYLEGLAEGSRAAYTRRIEEYRSFCDGERDGKVRDPKDGETVLQYVCMLHDADLYAAKSLWTIYSMVSSYYEAFHNRKAHCDVPMIVTKLKQWEKTEEVKKAASFEKRELDHYIADAPNDDTHHIRKVAMIIAIHGLLRKVELIDIM